MNRLTYPLSHEWHVAINKFNDGKHGKEWCGWMYEAKTIADEVPRLKLLFEMERTGSLKKTHKQCSMSPEQKVEDNHLTCCLGVVCSECPHLQALDSIERCSPEEVDTAKAWTCAAHIVSSGGDKAGEGYLLTVDDRMYWDNVYSHLSADDEIPE